jgi:hypothetical protein
MITFMSKKNLLLNIDCYSLMKSTNRESKMLILIMGLHQTELTLTEWMNLRSHLMVNQVMSHINQWLTHYQREWYHQWKTDKAVCKIDCIISIRSRKLKWSIMKNSWWKNVKRMQNHRFWSKVGIWHRNQGD